MLPHQFFKLLADETRVRCLMLIMREECLCVGDLTQALNESQPKISRHLAQLRSAGILVDVRQGQWVFYRRSSSLPGWMNKLIDDLVASNCLKTEYQQDIDRLNAIQARPVCCQ
ncbi:MULTISPECIES: metalloregulator ArsR/SmtB family transcription factor [Vibrio]|uniref:ArsR family transcriptional regulator n=2 Tax=Vibrio TaxID=662 RepID=A0A0C2NSK5_9VIBR|nr:MULTISPECIES: metalloregulator ArsR/SmtB family transcription factor [Vibrio]EGU36192.1 transcriptional regulator [Vibrio ichthyoenteri ATCC 700023]KII80263.1 ArsR family transcriptional regulator [Vibrio renipiscarius]KII82501.1 ArsR family transcriptional regulator [Vibrio renipiscarius]